MIALDGVTYRHAGSGRAALVDVSVAVGAGEVVGLVGANGAGKTTLCLVASGLAPRVVGGRLDGRVVVDGTDVAGLAMGAIAGQVGIVFDDPAAQLSGLHRTVYEEVAFGPANLGVDRAELIRRTEAALAGAGIEHLAARDPEGLSGGELQLVAIAAVVAMEPHVLILDEPTAGLDGSGSGLVGRAIADVAARGMSVLVAEHRTDLIAAISSRVVVLDGGCVVADGPTAEVLADPRLSALGIAEPSAVRLRRLAAEHGIDPARLVPAVTS